MEQPSHLKHIEQRLEKHKQSLTLARINLKRESLALAKADDNVWCHEQAQKLTQITAQNVQQRVHNQIASVVSRCLSAVFDEPYQFKIHFERKRGRTEARLVFVRDGEEIVPMQGSGGGVLDVAGFALRLACLMLSKPKARKLLILDEPFKFISSEYRERVSDLLNTLAIEMKIQFVMVTHIPELQTGKVVRIK